MILSLLKDVEQLSMQMRHLAGVAAREIGGAVVEHGVLLLLLV